MRKILLLILLIPCFVYGQNPVINSAPQKWLKWGRFAGSLFSDSAMVNSDSSNRVPNSAWIKQNIGSGHTHSNLTFNYGFTGQPFNFNGSAPVTVKVDTSHSSAGQLTWNYGLRFLTQANASGLYAPIIGSVNYIQNKYGIGGIQTGAKIAIDSTISTNTYFSVNNGSLATTTLGVSLTNSTSPFGTSPYLLFEKTGVGSGANKGVRMYSSSNSLFIQNTTNGSTFNNSLVINPSSITLFNASGFSAGIDVSALTAARTDTIQDKPGKFAFTSDIPSSLPPSGAAGGALNGTYPNPGLNNINQSQVNHLPDSLLNKTNFSSFGQGLTNFSGIIGLGGSITNANTTINDNGNNLTIGDANAFTHVLFFNGTTTEIGGFYLGKQQTLTLNPFTPGAVLQDDNNVGQLYAANNYNSTDPKWIPPLRVVDSLNALKVNISNLTTTVNYTKSYIADATTANVRNSEGDVLVVPATGLYLTAYSRFNRGTGDAGAATIVGRFSTDTTGNYWDNEFVISANIGLQTVLSVSLYAVSSTTYRCYFNVKNTTSDNRYYYCTSTNSGVTWGAATQLINDAAYDDVLNAVVHQVNSGRIIIPVATSVTTGSTWSCYAKYSDDGGTTWSNSNTVLPATTLGGVEPCIVQVSGNNLLMSMRTQSGFNWFSTSTDNGTTWGTPFQSTLPSEYSPTQMTNIGGKLVAFCNPNTSNTLRNPLSIYKSLDGGTTWTFVTNLQSSNGNVYSYSYPSLTISNGYLLVSYWEFLVADTFTNQKFTKIKISSLNL